MTRILLTIAALVTLTACETIDGAGQDIENAGEAISSEAQQTQAEM
ncbi:MAG: entericidin, EcnA/B family [Confluentimicrobium sp.]|jgi:predicted small secreted protein|uniref:Putative small secreted protein n=1 Tax=Actibacterium naphthalenivorans TaxID=1614693 RepID=A0A840CDS1_9RHOB|nr:MULTISPECIES: entericidin A/B family lipoprotein [Actibacterium]KGB83223.1 entericidin EcnAB [Rhodovulum sp. NI22]MDY6858691.1 entericidin A/B family lipoprotein [Pseudomonadota bacterium]ALG89413.1 entericidin EcnAB [Actibacterium sp. EMB200-NS6]MBB4020966.1 putative small secreted protein [Actibacterium naphthalenivorans]MBC56452.1 entericidin, EcnA/B family [Actibacterium sp.]|tara:strand:+ start:1604 stop:1741 length:138 start_codon:yes stop_codon:yes gene_type:complete